MTWLSWYCFSGSRDLDALLSNSGKLVTIENVVLLLYVLYCLCLMQVSITGLKHEQQWPVIFRFFCKMIFLSLVASFAAMAVAIYLPQLAVSKPINSFFKEGFSSPAIVVAIPALCTSLAFIWVIIGKLLSRR